MQEVAIEEKTIQKGYKNSALGAIPEDWEVKNLEDVCEKKGLIRGPFGGALKKDFFVTEGFKVYEQKNAIYKNANKGKYFVNEEKFKELRRFKVSPLDFIVSCSGTIGRIYQIPLDSDIGIINQALLKIRTNSDIINSSFFYQYFEWDKFQSNIIDNTQGGAMQNLVGMDIFRKTKFPIPYLDEQKAIADCLSTWDKAIEKLNQLISQKELRKKGLMQELLTGKKRLRGFDGEWIYVKLGKVCSLVNGMAFKPNDWKDSGIPIIRIQNLNGSDVFNYFQGKIEDRYLVNYGDLLFAWSGSRGTSFGAFRWFKDTAVLNQHIFNVFPKNELAKDFAFQILKWLTVEIERKAHGSAGLVHVTKRQLEDEMMKIPNNTKEQNSIAKLLESADKEIQLLKNKLEQLKMQKKGLMQVLLTGKKRLKY